MMDWETTKNILWVILSVVALVVAFRINIRFDINEWLERREETRKTKFQNLCPHMQIQKRDGNFYSESFFNSPPGTLQWICSRCNYATYDDRAQDLLDYWIKHPKEYETCEKSFYKLAKKMGFI